MHSHKTKILNLKLSLFFKINLPDNAWVRRLVLEICYGIPEECY